MVRQILCRVLYVMYTHIQNVVPMQPNGLHTPSHVRRVYDIQSVRAYFGGITLTYLIDLHFFGTYGNGSTIRIQFAIGNTPKVIVERFKGFFYHL